MSIESDVMKKQENKT